MAVYTRFTTQELDEFLNHYTVGTCKDLQEIQQGVENSNYFLWTTDNNRYVLTIYEKRVAVSDIPYFLDFTEYLKNKGINAPSSVKNKQGLSTTDFVGKKAALIHFLEGNNLDIPNPQQCYSAGQLIAQSHLAQKGFEGYRKNTLSPFSQDLYQLYASVKERLEKELPEIHSTAQEAFELINKNHLSDLPAGTIHADIFPDNMFFIGDEAVGIIDFYFSCYDFLAYDLAIALCAWCFDDKVFNFANYQHMLQGYQTIRPLSQAELSNLILLMQGAALRFMLTRAYDWLNTPTDAFVSRKNPYAFERIYSFLKNPNNKDMLISQPIQQSDTANDS